MKTNFQKIKGIFLDLDDTLYSYKSCNETGNRAALEFLSQALNIAPPEVEKKLGEAQMFVKQTLKKTLGFEVAASHSRLLYFQRVIESITGKINPILSLRAEELFWTAYLGVMEFFPNAKKFLEGLKQQSKTIAIITDLTHRIQLEKIVRLGIHDLIDFIVSSEEAGKDKPDPAQIFLTFQKTGLKPEEVVLIGESEKDIQAAQRAGVAPIMIHNKPSSSDVAFANDFAELCRMFNKRD